MNGKSRQQVLARTTPANGEIQRLMRALQTLSAVNRALLQAVDESALLQEICRVVVDDSGYRLAWASYAELDGAKSIRPVAHAGFEGGWLNALHSTWADTRPGRGPTATAIRTGQPQAVRNVQTDANLAPWREEAAQHGYASVLALPLRVDGDVIGALTIYASEPEAFGDKERSLLVQTAEDLGFGIGTLRTQARAQKAEQAVRRLAFYDALTGLPNRALLREYLERAIAAGKRENRTFSLLMVGVPTFHEINDALGYQVGDRLLVEVASRARSVAQDTDALARVAEDEFAVLLTHGGAEYASGIAKTLLQTLAEPIELSGFMVEPRISVGVALFPGHGTEPDQLIRRGNMAFPQAKRSGAGHAFYDEHLDKDNDRRLMLISDLRRAIEHDELLLYCQPKVHIGSGTVCGAEALVRWMHPVQGMILPTEFIKIAEQTALITPMTYWMLEAALRQLYSWRESGIKRPLAVNLSARDLGDPQLVDHIKGSIATWGIQPDEIQFELTESALMEDPEGALVTLSKLKDLDVKLSIDDFGTGYSSLSYLQKLPVDAIKIDQSFVSKVTVDKQSETIVRSTIELAHNLNLEVIAEGVESWEIWDRVSSLECDIAQGYFISKPIPSIEFSDWHRQSPWGSMPR